MTLLWFVKNWKTLATVAALVILIIFYAWVYSAATKACEQAVVYRTITRTIEVKKEHDKIRNNRPTANGVIISLQQGSF